MSESNAGDNGEPLKSASWLNRINANVLFAVTPEYADVQAARGRDYGQKPTFNRPPSMPLAYKAIAGVEIRYAHQGVRRETHGDLAQPFAPEHPRVCPNLEPAGIPIQSLRV